MSVRQGRWSQLSILKTSYYNLFLSSSPNAAIQFGFRVRNTYSLTGRRWKYRVLALKLPTSVPPLKAKERRFRV